MFYYLFTWLDRAFDFPGAGVFQYISFRAAMAVIGSLVISLYLENVSLTTSVKNKLVKPSENLALKVKIKKQVLQQWAD